MKYLSNNEKGSVLLVSMLVLMVLTLLGIVALDTTDLELMISRNDRTYKESFNGADGGGMAAIKVLRNTLDADAGLSTLPNITYAESADDFYNEAMGINPQDDTSDIAFSVGDSMEVNTDVQLLRVVNMAGGGAEFAAGYSGVGANGPKGMRYGVRTTSDSATSSTIYVEYLKVLGTPGGL